MSPASGAGEPALAFALAFAEERNFRVAILLTLAHVSGASIGPCRGPRL
jgi:hypothetical protein